MYPFCLTLDERQSTRQKRTGRRAKQQPTGKPIVPQPERLNKIFPAAEEVGDCHSKEEDGNGEEEEEPEEQGKGNWLRNSTLPFKGSTVAKPRPPRTGRKLKKRKTPNGCRNYGGAPSSTPPKTPRTNPMWFGSMSRRPRDPSEQGPLKETESPVETERTNVTAAEVNPPVPLPELPAWQSLKATSARLACGCPETVTDLPLSSERSGAGRHACSLPSRPLVLCQIRAPEDAAHTADGDICGAAHDADYDVGVAHGSDSRHGVEGNNNTEYR